MGDSIGGGEASTNNWGVMVQRQVDPPMWHMNRNQHLLWWGGTETAGFYFLFYQDPNLPSGALDWEKTPFFPPRDCLICLLRFTGTYTSSALRVIHRHPFNKTKYQALSSVLGDSGEPDVVPASDEFLWGMAAGK